MQTYTVGIRGSHDPDRWYTQLLRFEVTVARAELLIQDMVEQTLTELTDIYSEWYAALQHAQTCITASTDTRGAKVTAASTAAPVAVLMLHLLLRRIPLLF